MEWLAGPKGGGWFDMATGLSKLITGENPDIRMVVASGGGKDNPARLQKGDGHLAMSIDVLAAAAYRGQPPYAGEAMTKLRTIGVGWSRLPFHLLRARTVEANFRAAMTGRGFRIALPAKNTSDELTFQRVMEFYGTSYEKIAAAGGEALHGTYDEIVAYLKEGLAGYLFGATTKPAAIIGAAGEGPRAIELSAMAADLMEHLSKTYGYGRGIIPAGTYPKLQSADITTTFMETVFVISADVSDDVAYRITRTLLRNPEKLAAINKSMAEFNPRTAWQSQSAPLHPGAALAYRELGFMQ